MEKKIRSLRNLKLPSLQLLDINIFSPLPLKKRGWVPRYMASACGPLIK